MGALESGMGWGVEDADDEYEAKLAKKMQDEARAKAACRKASADLRKIRNGTTAQPASRSMRPELKNDIQNVSKAFDDWSFYDACKSGDTMTVCMLLDQCEGDELARRVNAATEDGSTPLFVAAWKGQTRVCNLLMDAKANINAIKKDGNTPLKVALKEGHTKTAKAIAGKSFDDWSFYDACKMGMVTTVSNLLAPFEGDELAQRVNVATEDGSTPLFVAAWKGQTAVCNLLMEAKANINAKKKDGNTALKVARKEGHTETAEAIER